MTRQEQTGIRDLTFSQWIRNKLPDSATGYSVTDLDFVLWNYKTKCVMIIEVKTRNTLPRTGQKIMFHHLHRWISNGIDKGWKYLGFHLIVFENTNFQDGKCWLDHKETTEQDLIKFLSFAIKTPD